MCSAISSVWKRTTESGSTNTVWVLFWALYPGVPGPPLSVQKPSPETDQLVEPSAAILPSATKPLVWLI
jgi:hypothetical protein